MNRGHSCVLTINGGSSSIKFAAFEAGKVPQLVLSGEIGRIGLRGMNLTVTYPDSVQGAHRYAVSDRHAAVRHLLDWIQSHPLVGSIAAVGHRIVHGLKHSKPEFVTPALLSELRRITPFAPDHLPIEIELIEAFGRRHPLTPQVACFDTAFHRTMPRVSRLLAIPRRCCVGGVERYGFHGISYEYLMGELGRIGDRSATNGRVILAHLGNGASLAAVQKGKSIDTSMGFTPASGLVMSTRTGDIDPGVLLYLARTKRMTARQMERMVNEEAGLLGISGASPDMRDLLRRESYDKRAAEAVALFCYQARKWIGSFAAALGGLDTLVFSGGIGENSPAVRERICVGLGFIGVTLDRRRNASNAPVISRAGAPINVRVIKTNEEMMIAKSALRILHVEKRTKVRL